ncbi:MAG TPA: adenylate/guanylate cyclase domain-containing protein [Coleofasciculaceae cyanobacterium]
MNVRPRHPFHLLRQVWDRRWPTHLKHLGWGTPASVSTIALISLAVTGIMGGVKYLGGFEPFELRAYDGMVRLRADQPIDSRLLVVTITEADLRLQQRSTLADQTIAEVLSILQADQPALIGLDLYRDLPQLPGHAALQTQLRAPNLIAITKLGDGDGNQVPPPPDVPPERVGFNDFPIDPDGVVRRSLLFGGTSASFSLQLALHYLNRQGITPRSTLANNMQLGDATFIPLEADSGGYQTNDARGYQFLLNYRSRQPVARQVTLHQVLKGEIQPEWVRNKIVLIGTTAPSSRDLFHTPYSAAETTHHQMAGLEIHAQTVSQILSAALGQQPLFWVWTEWQEWLWIGGWAVLGSSLAWAVRHPLRLGLGCSGILAALGSTSFLLFSQAGWVPVVAPGVAAITAVGAMLTYRSHQAQRQQQMVMTLLGQNTSKEIAAALWKHRDRLLTSGKLPGQQLVATMLFTDLKSFSTLSESIPPEPLLEWLNEYLGAMTQEVQRHQGIINKFTGDGLLAVFGVPVPRVKPEEIDQDAYQAVACALAMGDRLTCLNQEWQQRGLPVVQMRVGICTGTVVVGSLGSRDRMEYGVIGDTVNTASRLESCAKESQSDPCRILIAGETLKHVQNQFQIEPWGLMELKGKHNQIEVSRVMGHATREQQP